MGLWDDNDSKRTLGIRDKQILLEKAKYKCENPVCQKEIHLENMEMGHKKAWSRGGKTTLKNCVCLCHECNKLQGTDSWTTFLKKQGIKDEDSNIKEKLKNLTLGQLKNLAESHNIKVKGRINQGLFEDSRSAPRKNQYILKLKNIITAEEINALPQEVKIKKKRKRRETDSWL